MSTLLHLTLQYRPHFCSGMIFKRKHQLLNSDWVNIAQHLLTPSGSGLGKKRGLSFGWLRLAIRSSSPRCSVQWTRNCRSTSRDDSTRLASESSQEQVSRHHRVLDASLGPASSVPTLNDSETDWTTWTHSTFEEGQTGPPSSLHPLARVAGESAGA